MTADGFPSAVFFVEKQKNCKYLLHFSAECGIVYPLIYDLSKEVTSMKDIPVFDTENGVVNVSAMFFGRQHVVDIPFQDVEKIDL